MRMARQQQFSIRRETLLQLLQPRRQSLEGRGCRAALLVREACRINLKLRQFPDLLLHDGAGCAGDIGRRIRRPVEAAQRMLGGIHQMRHDFMLAEHLDCLGNLLQQKMHAMSGTIEPDKSGLVEPWSAIGLAEWKPGDGFGCDRKATALYREFLMIRIETECFSLAVGVAQRNQALATKIELQANILERPRLRRFSDHGKMHHPLAVRPILVMFDRLALESPAVDRSTLSIPPMSQFGNANFKTIEALGNGQRHGLSC